MSRNSPGEGSVCQRADGRWQAAIQVDGHRKVAYASTERKARHALIELRQEAGSGPLPQPGCRTVNDLLDAWLDTARAGLKPTSLAWYTTIAATHVRPVLGPVRLSRLDPAHIQRLLNTLDGRLAKATHTTLHRACRFGVLWGWLASNPVERVMAPVYQAPRHEVWAPEQLRALLEGTAQTWLGPVWVLCAATGCRIGEVLGLTWECVAPNYTTIDVRGSLQRVGGAWVILTPKTPAGARIVTLPPEASAALQRQRELQGAATDAGGYVFTGETGGPVSRWTAEHALPRECKRLGLPRITPHGLRHLHASLLLDAGLALPNVSARLGHSRPSITMGVYAHRLAQGDELAAGVISDVLRGQTYPRG